MNFEPGYRFAMALRVFLYAAALVSAPALASEAMVKQAIEKKYPDVRVESVTRTPIAGLYEVYARGDVLYVDEDVNYMIVQGRMIDVERQTDLTAQRMRVLTGVKFDQLPLNLAFRKVQGKGTHKLAYFADPNCPYCKQLEAILAKLEDVTIYFFLYPVLGQDSYDKARAVWYSKDRVRAWDDMMLRGKPPKGVGNCDTPIDSILAFGREKNIRGTPTLIFANGQRVTGLIPAEELTKLLEGTR